MRPTALIALTETGAQTARRVQAALPGAVVYGLAGRVADCDAPFAAAAAQIAACFAEGRAVVGICAAGILVRALAPVLGDKRREPPVVAVAEDGSTAVPLLGGHRGANRLARRIADALGGAAAITTAGDLALGLALDEPPPGWRVANPAAAKAVSAALLADAPVRLDADAPGAEWLAEALPCAAEAEVAVRVTDRAPEPDPAALVLHPPVLALGVGCERGADPAELRELVADSLAAAGLAAGAVAGVFSIDLKADEPAVHALAEDLAVPARFFPAARLAEEAPRLATPSEAVLRETGCPGVAEGAALAAAGPEAALVVPKRKSRRCTCAVARATAPLDGAAPGCARGRLDVVGIGPGPADWRTPEATWALAAAEHVVGYGLYLDLLGGLIAGKQRHESALGEEEARARLALDLAAGGAQVALVSSGDAGIYALATLVYELLDREDRPDWNRVALSVLPGVSALQAAAARAGAPLGHDFCAISLSDLLTPWPTIEARLQAAARADFVVALFNPRSRRRIEPLEAALRILRDARGADAPVVLARQLGRADESLTHTTLGALDSGAVDMLSLVLVGNRETRTVTRGARRFAYTPRGYGGGAPS